MNRFAYKSAVVAFFCVSESLAAQRVSGHLRESASQAPVAGAVVSLLDSAGHMVTRTLSRADGQYLLVGNGQGVSVHAIRIGFRPATQPIPGAARDTSVVIDIALTTLPTLLETVEVHDQALCPDAQNAQAAFALWDQARSALLATVVSREVNPPTVRMVSYSRDLDARGTHIDAQAVSDSIYLASRPVVSARTAEQFAARGYRDDHGNGAVVTYYGPDADVLLDSTFLRGHCVSLRQNVADHPDAVGIAFTPVRDQDSVVDISGVLWLNSSVPALQSLNFRFTNLSKAEMAAGAGGDLLFTEMPNGVALISRWNLHAPMVRLLTVGGGAGGFVGYRVVGFHDMGGELAEASWNDGLSWIGPLATIGGHVVVAGTGAPVANSPVRFRGTRIATQTDSAGAFTLPLTVPGPYVVDASDGLMERFGVQSSGSATVVADRSPISDVRVTLPSRKTAIASFCAESTRPTSGRVLSGNLLVGQVRLANGTPAANAFVRGDWVNPIDPIHPIRFDGASDSTGTFQMCDAPAARAMTLSAARGALVSKDAAVSIDSLERVAAVVLTLDTPEALALPAYRRRRIDITDDISHLPLAGAEVLDETSDRSLGLTFADGSVSMASLPPGRSLLRVRKVGYGQQTVIINVDPKDTLPVAVSLQTATQLATVKVTADAIATVGSRLAYESGFEDRAKVGIGHFMTVKDFDRHPADNLANALQQMGVTQGFLGAGGTVLLGGHMGKCPVTIYMDGALLYAPSLHQPLADVSSMQGIDFAAAEYYAGASEVPAEYNVTGTSPCGVLLLWRKN
jgi:hypothetical protein